MIDIKGVVSYYNKDEEEVQDAEYTEISVIGTLGGKVLFEFNPHPGEHDDNWNSILLAARNKSVDFFYDWKPVYGIYCIIIEGDVTTFISGCLPLNLCGGGDIKISVPTDKCIEAFENICNKLSEFNYNVKSH